MPAYNEEGRLGRTLSLVADYLDRAGIESEILVVDDGSTDGTTRVADSLPGDRRFRLLRNEENRGKGFSVRRGVLEAAGRWVLVTDADLSSPIEQYEVLAKAARDRDLDVAIGSRALRQSRIEVRQGLVRQTMGKIFNGIIRTMTGLPFHDTQCGFKLMDRQRVEPIIGKMVVDRFAFDVELLFLCVRFGLKVEEVPVVWRNDPATKVSMLRDPLNMIFDVARVRWRFRRGLYHADLDAPGRA